LYERQVGGYKKKIYCSNKCSRIGRKINPYIPTEQHKKSISDTRKRDWVDGEIYKNVQAARTKWVNYTSSSGEIYKVQGTWEYKFLEWLDKNSLTFKVHQGHLKYKDQNNDERIYLPDFYVDEWKSFVDIKNDYLFSLTKDKFDYISRSNPNINIKILLKEDLLKLGIIL
jgi:hypothetical protein